MGRISHSRWTFHVVVITSDRLLAAIGCRLLAPIVSRSFFQHSSSIVGSGLLATVNVVGSSSWMASATALWNASVDDTASTYLLATHGKTSLCKFDPNKVNLLIFMKI
jgi:hypothetical protein